MALTELYVGLAAAGAAVLSEAGNERRDLAGAGTGDRRRRVAIVAMLVAGLYLLAGSLIGVGLRISEVVFTVSLAVAGVVAATGLVVTHLAFTTPAPAPPGTASRWRRVAALGAAAVLGTCIGVGVNHFAAGGSGGDHEPASAYAKLTPKALYVFGTCASNACHLNRRAKPDGDAPKTGSQLDDGDRVLVLCQEYGGRMTAKGRRVSWLWDLLADRTWVSDLFISSAKSGASSHDLPRCPTHVSA